VQLQREGRLAPALRVRDQTHHQSDGSGESPGEIRARAREREALRMQNSPGYLETLGLSPAPAGSNFNSRGRWVEERGVGRMGGSFLSSPGVDLSGPWGYR
jgi:hypothetical protein